MAQVQSEGIKLFGATITLHGRQRKEEDHHNKKGGGGGGGSSSSDQGGVTDIDEEKKPNKIIACPRCKSMDTKFCYFNNYNVNQPRHFCKGCQRYWTAGGALRNVPVGAGRRKAKPPCRQDGYESSTTVEKFGLDHDDEGLVLDDVWDVATVVHGGFRQMFASKRRRTSSDGQPC